MHNIQTKFVLSRLTKTVLILASSTVLLTSTQTLQAQGCVAARGAGMTCATGLHLSEELPPSAGWQSSVGYRFLHSHRHFVGDVEQKQREAEGSEVINRSQFIDFGVTYAFNPRFSATLTIPFSIHDRSSTVRSNDTARTILQRYHTQSSGLGDLRLEGNAWILDPEKNPKGNILFGLGVDMPTGEKDAKDTFQVFSTNGILAAERTVDQSIQPGDGGWGIILDIYAYQQIAPRLNVFINGGYTITPEEKSGVPTYRSNPFEAEMSIADTYMGRAGLEYVISPKHGLAFSLAGRIEGVPVRDLVGGSEGFRRPGFAISIEPGLSLMVESWSFNLYTPIALYRNRQRSVPDMQTSATAHGDAAFADYLVMFSVTKRF